ncbi:Selenocysteine lyase/Cysteine desulfurase [Terribacillus aidingensis]|uniref:Selenocysteine lyase/Cysteine desulfurase n=1 Tax=Terribacillus aidingensis TaxID=586416 RepID=A0A285P1H8_9BACI|nr:aminotransferase class V-fold PLP-dependent enzyme [Terribacillus aidingensis]SNZ15594.1 Selenocysteine lyase/Cysteine desulfurase [Terribacillus aidingensis]
MAKQVDWDKVRGLFNLNREYIHIGTSQYFVSHPKHIRDAIEKYRKKLDENPTNFTENNEENFPLQVRKKLVQYMGIDDPNLIALTDSATMGLGIIYTGLNINKDHDILTPEHNHYSHQEAIRQVANRTGASFREVPVYHQMKDVTEESLVQALLNEIRDNTVVIGLTWVQSDTGLKFPVKKFMNQLKKINKKRDKANQIIVVLDGTHGFGIETETFPELDCDFFITSCHKWLYGPRGTGFVAAKKEAWGSVTPVIPSYTILSMVSINEKHPKEMNGTQMTPGGFHSMEHRWALKDAFEFALDLGKDAIYERVHQLNRQVKEGLASMSHVTLHTPIADELSAGITAFEVKGMKSKNVVKKLHDKKIIGTVAPYQTAFARLTPGIYNTPEEIDQVLEAIHSLK